MTLVLITSVINVCKSPLCYCPVRSVFTKEERLEQTIHSIYSVRKHIPNAKIFLIECSNLQKEEEYFFYKLTDYYLNIYSDETARSETESASKTRGEKIMTIYALKYILENIEIETLFKLSGRYWLEDTFDLERYRGDTVVVRYDPCYVSTTFYKLDKKHIPQFFQFLCHLGSLPNDIGWEGIFQLFLDSLSTYTAIEKNGVAGQVSIDNFSYQG